jgi:hypothetical protein
MNYKLWTFLLVITTSICIFLWVGWRKASASSDFEQRIVQTHERILRDREQKKNDCEALWLAMPYYLIDICWTPLSLTE